MKSTLRPLARAIAVSALTAVMFGCSGEEQMLQSDAQSVDIELVYATAQCGRQEDTSALTQITKVEDVTALLTNNQDLGAADPTVPNVDFETETVVLLELGQRGNSGYSLELTGSSVEVTSSDLPLPVAEAVPSKDGYYASVVVSPCLVLKFATLDFQTVSALGLTLDIQ